MKIHLVGRWRTDRQTDRDRGRHEEANSRSLSAILRTRLIRTAQ